MITTSIILTTLILLVISGGSFLLAAAVYFRGGKQTSNVFFSLTSAATGCWTLISVLRYYYFLEYGSPPLIFTYLSLAFAASIFYFFLLFVYSVKSEQFEMPRLYFWLAFGLYLVSVIAIFVPDFIIHGESFLENTVQPVFDWTSGYYLLYVPALFTFYIWSVAYIFSLYRHAVTKSQEQQFLYIFLASLCGGVIGLGFGLLVPLFPVLVNLYWIGKVGVFVFIFFCSYAILKYHLFNLKIIAVEITVLVLAIFLLVNIFVSETVNERLGNTALFVLTVILGVFLSRAVRKEVRQKRRLKKINNDIEEINENLEALDRQKTEFVSLASHQLRTPLTSVKGYASMLLEGSFGKLKSGAQEAVTDIFEHSQALAHVVENLLVVSRIEQGQIDYEFSRMNFEKIAGGIFEKWKSQAREQGLEMTFEVSNGHVYEICGDKEKLSQVVTTLIKNALEYTEEGFIRLLLTHDDLKQMLRFSVSDTGLGMTKKQAAEIFTGYREPENKSGRVSYEFQPNMELYITSEFIKAHDGKIWVDSPGKRKGSTFFVELPFYKEGAGADQ